MMIGALQKLQEVAATNIGKFVIEDEKWRKRNCTKKTARTNGKI